jgi:DNA-directed RNA polymerase alpha subunit
MININELNLSARTVHSLERGQIKSTEQLTSISPKELKLRVFGMGKKQIAELQDQLKANGLSLKRDAPAFSDRQILGRISENRKKLKTTQRTLSNWIKKAKARGLKT